jgi:riboflavin transporter FmnP
MRSQRSFAGVFAALSIVLGLVGFACVMSHVGGSWPFLAFPASAIAAFVGYLFLGAPRSRRVLARLRD